MKRSALGKGIAALIPDAPSLRPGALVEVAASSIQPNPLQPRRRFTEEGLRELTDSIRQHGLLQPVVVSRAGDGGYVLIAGERRWRAAVAAGLQQIPAVVREAAGDDDTLALALIENLQREDLTPIEQARAYHHLRAELGLSQEAIAGAGSMTAMLQLAQETVQEGLPVREVERRPRGAGRRGRSEGRAPRPAQR